MIKTSIIAAAIAAFIFLGGCSKANEGSKRPVPPVAPVVQEMTHPHPPDDQSPYYYGLIAEYESLLAEDPDNLATNIALANAYYDSGQWREAILYYGRALQIDPRNPDIRTDMATSYRNLGMSEVALDQYRKALEYDPGHLNARYNIGVIYAHDRRDYAAAIHIWDDLLRIAPHHPRADYMRTSIAAFKRMATKGAHR